jgi:SAM-dependent methyltransferase
MQGRLGAIAVPDNAPQNCVVTWHRIIKTVPNFVQQSEPENMKTDFTDHCNVCGSNNLKTIDPACNIAKCGNCGYIFDNPRPALEELIAFYSKPSKYDSWLAELSGRDRMWARRVRKLRSTRKAGSLLDIGTGIGQFLALARPMYASVYGTEVSDSGIAIARERYGLDIYKGMIDELAKEGRSFDNVSLFHVLEHVPDPKLMIETCYSLLSEEGILVIAVPNEVTSLRALAKRALRGLGLRRRDPGKLGLPLIRLDGSISEIHLSHFRPKVLQRLVETSGFSVITSTLDPYYVRDSSLSWFKADIYYYVCLLVRALFRVNIFDAMLVIARKTGFRGQPVQAGRK